MNTIVETIIAKKIKPYKVLKHRHCFVYLFHTNQGKIKVHILFKYIRSFKLYPNKEYNVIKVKEVIYLSDHERSMTDDVNPNGTYTYYTIE